MEHLRFSDVDSTDEVCKVFNQVIDNLNQVQRKVCQMAEQQKKTDAYNKKVDKFNKSIGTEGFVSTKLLMFIVLFVSLFVGVTHGAFRTTDINYDIASNPETLVRYLRDSFANLNGTSVVFTPTDTVPPATEGTVYCNDTANNLKLRTDSAWVDIDVSGASSLDAAYGIGAGITVDAGAVTLTAGSSDDNVVLALVQGDTDATVAALTVTSAGDAAAIIMAQSGSGTDIQFSDGGSISKASALIIEGGITDLTDGSAILMDTNNEIEFGDNSEDVSFNFATTDTVALATDSGLDSFAFGVVDDLEGVGTITFDDAASTITLTSSGATDLTISQATSGQDASLILQSSGTGTDALSLITSVADISLVSADNITRTAANDITDVTTDGAYTLTIGGSTNGKFISTVADTFSMIVVDTVLIQNTEAAKDINIDSQLGRVIVTGTESAAAAVSLVADGAAGGINIDAKTGGVDIDAVGGSINLDTSGAGIDIDLDATAGAVSIDGGQTGADAVVIIASHTDGGINMDFGTGGLSVVGASGDMVLTLAGAAGDLFTLTNTTGTGAGAIGLVATAGGITAKVPDGKELKLGNTALNTYFSVAAHGTPATEFVSIVNTAGTSVTENSGAIQIWSLAGGIQIQSDGDLDDAIVVRADGGTTAEITIHNDAGTATDSIEIVSDDGGILIDAGGGAGDNIVLTATTLVVANGELINPATAGTKVLHGVPIMIEFRPTTAETLTYTVPTGYDLVITDAWGYKITGAGSGGGDQIDLQNNDGSATNIFATEELNAISEKARFQFDTIEIAETLVEAGHTLDCVTTEDSNVDSVVTVVGYLITT